ncbi:MAG TPA: fluoride efflux transporter CrcB [Myxococcota bacterium]|nr:fluoride efflux transporter CrcB [Myxococcota bacterium]
MERFLWICLGGALGTGARYLVSGWVLAALGPAFPYGTLAVNVLGSFALGGVMHVGLATEWISPTLRLALSVGLTGGFTTFSAFSYETTHLLQEGAWGVALLNAGVSVVACVAATFLGLVVARWAVGA